MNRYATLIILGLFFLPWASKGVIPSRNTTADADPAIQALVDGVSMQGAERIYIVDPLGNLMMYYPPGADPGGMHKDLKKLLKYSKIG